MKDRPILFSGPMVRALLAGTKTQTRRVVKVGGTIPSGAFCDHAGYEPISLMGNQWGFRAKADKPLCTAAGGSPIWRCPYGQPGDRLWVREGVWLDTEAVPQLDPPQRRAFFCDTNRVKFENGEDGESPFPLSPKLLKACGCQKFVPSIHMPRWASRITLEISGVRVERLHEISEEDAKAEGCEFEMVNDDPSFPEDQIINWKNYLPKSNLILSTARWSYRTLWNSINGPDSWHRNDWVWVVEFRRVKGGAA